MTDSCEAPRCAEDRKISTYCARHYHQFKAGRPFTNPGDSRRANGGAVTECAVSTCDRARKHQGLCAEHTGVVPITYKETPGGKRLCGLVGCKRPLSARKMCKLHYDRFITGKGITGNTEPEPIPVDPEALDDHMTRAKDLLSIINEEHPMVRGLLKQILLGG